MLNRVFVLGFWFIVFSLPCLSGQEKNEFQDMVSQLVEKHRHAPEVLEKEVLGESEIILKSSDIDGALNLAETLFYYSDEEDKKNNILLPVFFRVVYRLIDAMPEVDKDKDKDEIVKYYIMLSGLAKLMCVKAAVFNDQPTWRNRDLYKKSCMMSLSIFTRIIKAKNEYTTIHEEHNSSLIVGVNGFNDKQAKKIRALFQEVGPWLSILLFKGHPNCYLFSPAEVDLIMQASHVEKAYRHQFIKRYANGIVSKASIKKEVKDKFNEELKELFPATD